MVINCWTAASVQLASNRVDYWVVKGYLEPIQVGFWDMIVDYSVRDYASEVPHGLLDQVWGSLGWLALGLGILGAFVFSGRWRWFALACVLFMAALALYQRLPFFPRYFSPFLVASALGTGVAIAALTRRSSHVPQLLGVASLIALVGLSAMSYSKESETAEATAATVLSPNAFRKPVALIPSGGGVIGTRSSYLNFIATDIRAYGEQFLTEDEYVTLLTWPSDNAVIQVMERHDISWVYVPRPPWRWVYKYNRIWVQPAYHMPVVYQGECASRTGFSLAAKTKTTFLYRLRTPTEAASNRGLRNCTPAEIPRTR